MAKPVLRAKKYIVIAAAAVELPWSFKQLEELINDRMFGVVRQNAYHPEKGLFEALATNCLFRLRIDNAEAVRPAHGSNSGALIFRHSTCAQDIPAARVARSAPPRRD